jgi:hypothetical protein
MVVTWLESHDSVTSLTFSGWMTRPPEQKHPVRISMSSRWLNRIVTVPGTLIFAISGGYLAELDQIFA